MLSSARDVPSQKVRERPGEGGDAEQRADPRGAYHRGPVAVALLAGSVGPALAAPPPPPPPNPTDGQLDASRAAVTQRTTQVAGLSARLSALDDQAAAIALQLSARQEQANRALVDQQNAQAAADEASRAAAAARQATVSASADVDALRARVDEFVAARYQQGLDIGPLGLLTAPGGPQGRARPVRRSRISSPSSSSKRWTACIGRSWPG